MTTLDQLIYEECPDEIREMVDQMIVELRPLSLEERKRKMDHMWKIYVKDCQTRNQKTVLKTVFEIANYRMTHEH